jgi:hypothetical protein
MITQIRLRQVLNYSPETGEFTWIVQRRGKAQPSTAAGSLNSMGYVVIMVDGQRHKAHRLAWLWEYGALPLEQIDHINGVRADNRIANLRLATVVENKRNSKCRADNTTGFKGVTPPSGRSKQYQASISIGGKRRYLGRFPTAEEAHAAYVKAADHLFGEFARPA